MKQISVNIINLPARKDNPWQLTGFLSIEGHHMVSIISYFKTRKDARRYKSRVLRNWR